MQPPLTGPGVDPELRLPTSEELPCSDDTPVDAEQERQRAEHMAQALEQERLENLRLLERLRQLGESDE
jgi:hypothetical protein